jgi:hypothetical protein
MRPSARLALFATPFVAAACGGSPRPEAVVVVPRPTPEPIVIAPPEPLPSRVAYEWSVFGDTPTVAWSPDGARIAVAHQVNYLSAPDTSGNSGIDVVDMRSGMPRRVHKGPGYHPVWLSNETIAFGCSTYECDNAEGLYLLEKGRAERVLSRGVYHTRRAQSGGVLFFSGFPEAEGWMLWDPATRAAEPVRGAKMNSWKPPAAALADQCPAQTRGRRVDVRGGQIVVRDDETGKSHKLGAFPPWKLEWPEDAGVIKPCLSPDGRYVVYFAKREGSGFVGVLSVDDH